MTRRKLAIDFFLTIFFVFFIATNSARAANRSDSRGGVSPSQGDQKVDEIIKEANGRIAQGQSPDAVEQWMNQAMQDQGVDTHESPPPWDVYGQADWLDTERESRQEAASTNDLPHLQASESLLVHHANARGSSLGAAAAERIQLSNNDRSTANQIDTESTQAAMGNANDTANVGADIDAPKSNEISTNTNALVYSDPVVRSLRSKARSQQ